MSVSVTEQLSRGNYILGLCMTIAYDNYILRLDVYSPQTVNTQVLRIEQVVGSYNKHELEGLRLIMVPALPFFAFVPYLHAQTKLRTAVVNVSRIHESLIPTGTAL